MNQVFGTIDDKKPFPANIFHQQMGIKTIMEKYFIWLAASDSQNKDMGAVKTRDCC